MKPINQITAFLFLIMLSIEITAQIPNGGFETWQIIQNFEKPLLWHTNQDTNFVRFEKDTIAVQGNYSLKVVPSALTAWQDCMSYAWTGVNLNAPIGENKSLAFYVKTIPDSLYEFESVFLSINGKLFESGNLDSNYEWTTFEKIEDFTKIQIPITNPNIDSLTIQIFGGALNGAADGCPNRSYSWIDGMGIERTGIVNSNFETEEQETDLSIFPNPSDGTIEIGQTTKKFNTFYLYSLNGKLVEYGSLNSTTIKLKNAQKGVFIIRLINENENQSFAITRKIVIK